MLISNKGRELQFDHRVKRKWEIQHPRLDMFRSRNHEYEYSPGAEPPGMRRKQWQVAGLD